MKKSKRKITEAQPKPAPRPLWDWRDVAAAAWAAGVLVAFVIVLWNAGVLALLAQVLAPSGGS